MASKDGKAATTTFPEQKNLDGLAQTLLPCKSRTVRI